MTGEKRREKLITLLGNADKPLSGAALAKELKVSRQVIVQDITILRASGNQLLATNRGYLLEKEQSDSVCRVFKVRHSDEDTEKEMNLIVDLGGILTDVFVYHRAYGIIRGDLNVHSRLDVRRYLDSLRGGSSRLLKNVTDGYHYHTVIADRTEILDLIENELAKQGFLAALSEYEPEALKR